MSPLPRLDDHQADTRVETEQDFHLTLPYVDRDGPTSRHFASGMVGVGQVGAVSSTPDKTTSSPQIDRVANELAAARLLGRRITSTAPGRNPSGTTSKRQNTGKRFSVANEPTTASLPPCLTYTSNPNSTGGCWPSGV